MSYKIIRAERSKSRRRAITRLCRRSPLQLPEPASLAALAKRPFGPSSGMADLMRCAFQVFVARSFHTRACDSSLKAQARDHYRSAAAGDLVRLMRGLR
jgi:hypothetical protein